MQLVLKMSRSEKKRAVVCHIQAWLICLFLWPITIFAQDLSEAISQPTSTIELTTYIEKSSVPLNEEVAFHIRLSWLGDMSRYKIVEIPQPLLTNLLMEGSGSKNQITPAEDGTLRSTKTITYKFKPVEIGMAYIDGLVVKYRDSATGETDMLQSQRVQVKILDALPDSSGNVTAVVYIVLLLLFALTIAYFLMQYLKKRNLTPEESGAPLSIPRQFLKRMSEEIDPKATNLGEMSVLLSRIFREFLSREFSFPAANSSIDEVRGALRKRSIAELEINKITELLEKLDVIKFAGGSVDPAEFSNLYGTAENYLHGRQAHWESEKAQMKEA